MPRWLETDTLENHDLSAAHVVGTYTCDADRLVLAQVFLDTVAGSDDYVFYATVQIAGAGSEYVLIPKTTAAAAAGETAIGAQSILVSLKDDDVLKVYVDCIAADSSVDSYCRFFEIATLQAVTPANRTVVVDVNGLVAVPATQKVDVETIKTKAVAVDVGGTTFPAVVGTSTLGGTAQTGDSYAIVNHADHGNAKLVRSTTPANTLTVDASHRALSDLASILGTALTETTPGWIAAAVKKLFNVAAPTGTINSLPDAVPGAANGLAIVGSQMALDATSIEEVGTAAIGYMVSIDTGLNVSDVTSGSVIDIMSDAVLDEALGAHTGHLAVHIPNAVPGASGGLATADNQTTILERLGAWTGTGINTILGAFRALAGKASSLTPTDLSSGTTFDNTTDSQEAIRDAMALEATLTAIKGAGWTTETLAAIDVLIDAIKAKTDLITPDTALTVVSPVDGGDITIAVTASFAGTVSGLTIPSTWTKLWFSVKAKRSDADAAAKLQLVVSNPAAVATDGVLYVASGTATSAQRTKGSLTVSQAAGTVAIALDETLTAVLSKAGGLEWDIKCLESGGACTVLTEGDAVIGLTVTRALV